MNTQKSTPPMLFAFEAFYGLAQCWPKFALKPALLDTLDILSFHTDTDGRTIRFEARERYRSEAEKERYWRGLAQQPGQHDSYPESWWQHVDLQRRLGPVLSRPTYAKCKNWLIEHGYLRKATDKDPFDYQFVPAFESSLQIIYRHRGYLDQRWPLWLGQNCVTRIVLLAFLDAMAEQTIRQAQLSSYAELSEDDLLIVLGSLLGEDQPTRDQIQTALQQLRMLAALTLAPVNEHPAPRTHRLHITIFESPPVWSSSELQTRFCAARAQDTPWINPFIQLLRACCHPVDQAKSLWNTLVNEYIRAGVILADSVDLQRLESFIGAVDRYLEKRPLAYIPAAKTVLQLFVEKRIHAETRWVSAPLSFELADVAIVRAVAMPHPTAHHLDATQLEISYRPDAGLSDAEIYASLHQIQFLIWQAVEQGEPQLILIHPQLPKTLDRNAPLIVRCNHLHGRLDYSRPFDLLLKCAVPTTQIHITCRFILLHQQPVRGKQAGKPKKRPR